MKTCLILFAVIFLFMESANATTYFISPSGNNGNSGLSSSAAFQTIDKGILTATNYDTVMVLAGLYSVTAQLTISKPITLLGKGAVIDGGAWSPATQNKKFLFISNTNDVLVDGIVFKNLIGDYSIAIAIIGSGTNITVQHCFVTNIGWTGNDLIAIPTGSNNANGILVDGTSATSLSRINIQYDTITNCALGRSEALTVVANVDTFTIASNFIYANSNIGIDISGSKTFAANPPSSVNYARNGKIIANTVFNCMSPIAASAGIYLDGAYGCIVDGNTLFNNAVGISLGQETPVSAGAKSCSNNKVINNLIYRNAVTGVIWGDDFSNSPEVVNNLFTNNTLFRNRTGAVINGVTAIGGIPAGTASNQYGNVYGGEVLIHDCDSSSFDNNILFPLDIRHCVVVPDSYVATNLLFNYNNFNRDNINVSYFDIGSGSSANGNSGVMSYYTSNVVGLYLHTIVTDPAFADTSIANFHLKVSPSSPCINAGNPSTTTMVVGNNDYDGNLRIYDGRIDIGAFESQVTLQPLPIILDNFNATQYGTLINCKWLTLQEINSKYFEVQRSDDGKNFKTIATIVAAGNSDLPHNYRYTDTTAFILYTNDIYYRLKMVGKDASVTYSSISKLTLKGINNLPLNVYPNPVKNQLQLTFNSDTNEEAILSIKNLKGEFVYQKKITLKIGTNKYLIDINNLSPTVYYLTLFSHKIWMSRIVKL